MNEREHEIISHMTADANQAQIARVLLELAQQLVEDPVSPIAGMVIMAFMPAEEGQTFGGTITVSHLKPELLTPEKDESLALRIRKYADSVARGGHRLTQETNAALTRVTQQGGSA